VIITIVIFCLIDLSFQLVANVRAFPQSEAMAKAMGIRTDWVDTMTFGLGSRNRAGVAGVTLTQLTTSVPICGAVLPHHRYSFMVVVSAVSNLWGSFHRRHVDGDQPIA